MGDGPITRHLSESEMKHAFDFAEYACFCSLSERTDHISSSKVNRDCFTLYAQKFEIGNPMMSFRSRRLGGSSLGARNIDELFISAPIHCDLREITLNNKLLVPLVENYIGDEIWLNAITCFNQANTDSNDVPKYIEFILLAGAFDRILSSGQKFTSERLATEFANRFQLADWPLADSQSEYLEAWFFRFFGTRHGPAHGDLSRENLNSLEGWEDLLIAKLAFPLLLKILLNNENQYELSAHDKGEIFRLQGKMCGEMPDEEEIATALLEDHLKNRGYE